MLLAAAAAFAVFANTLSNGFVSDDEQLVLLNPWITDPRFLAEIFSSSAWGFLNDSSVSNYYRPLVHLIYLVTHGIFGLEAWGFHLVNVLFHVANTVVVFALTARLVALSELADQFGKFRSAGRCAPYGSEESALHPLSVPFIAALLFATHPIHAEAVNWVASVQELSFTLLYLLSFHLYLAPDAGGRRRVASAALFFLALLCKETALTLPALLVVYDLAVGDRRTAATAADAVRRYLPYVVAVALYALLRHNALSDLVPAAGILHLDLYQSIINLPPLFAANIAKLMLPVGLSFRHPFAPISSLWTLQAAVGAAVAAAYLAALLAAWRKDRLAFLCLALVVLPLLPTFYINALAVNPFAERFLYLPSVGFVILAAMLLRALAALPRAGIAAWVVLVVATLWYSSAALARNGAWKDAYTCTPTRRTRPRTRRHLPTS